MKKKFCNIIIILPFIVSIFLIHFLSFQEKKTNENENSSINEKHDYGYEFLDNKQQEIYNFLEKRTLKLNEEIMLDKEYDYDYIHKVLELYRTNNLELCSDYCYGEIQETTEKWIYKDPPVNKIKAIRVLYPLDNFEMRYKEAEKIANEIISKMPQNISDINRIKYVHDYIVDNIAYDMNPLSDATNSVIALLENRALCIGYARTFEFLIKKLGFQVITISGKVGVEKIDHAWNMIKIDNNWYHIDCTWDNNKFDKYQFFLLSDDEINIKRKNEIQDYYSLEIPTPKASHKINKEL